MSHRQRLETAWNFREPDRVPVEMGVSSEVRNHPSGQRLLDLIAEHADNFAWAGGADWGFLGFPTTYHEETIEDKPGQYRRIRRTHETTAGTFTAITWHPAGEIDYHWEKRFVSSIDDLRRLAETPRPKLQWDAIAWRKRVEEIGESALPLTGVLHPLGFLVRNATMEDVYAWLYEERALMHRFLEAANAQVAQTLSGMIADGIGPYFCVTAHEMLLPPWLGHKLFDEFVFPYDKAVNSVIRRSGGKLRAHIHGNCMDFLEKLYEMGIDAIEPLEHPPYGDVDLAEAKRRMKGRMMLSGNVHSQDFATIMPEQTRERVREAIRIGAPGGGFSLRTSGGDAGTGVSVTEDVMNRIIANCEAYLLAGVELGQYPIR
jgi:hypothetical protein